MYCMGKPHRTCADTAHPQELAAEEARGLAANPQLTHEGITPTVPPPVDNVLQDLQGTVRSRPMAHNPLAIGHCLPYMVMIHHAIITP